MKGNMTILRNIRRLDTHDLKTKNVDMLLDMDFNLLNNKKYIKMYKKIKFTVTFLYDLEALLNY